MTINKDKEDGLLDDAGKSRRFVQHYKNEENSEKSKKTINEAKKANKKIANRLKYGNKKNDISQIKPLTTAEQIRIAAGFQQAVIKITSYGKGVDKVLSHLAYLTRNFDLSLEDQNQSLLKSKDDIVDLVTSWESIFFDARKNSRDTVHLVLSAPPETNRETFKQVTRDFLNEEYGGEHDYLFVPHNDTEHPHVHAVICLRSVNGKKLDPRKNYLNELRKNFAGKCREHGIMLDASRRFDRGLSGKSVKSELVHIRDKRNEISRVDRGLIERIKHEVKGVNEPINTGEGIRIQRNENIRTHFYNTAKKLYENYLSTSIEHRLDKDLKASKLLFDYSKRMPREQTRADYLKELLNKGSSMSFSYTTDFFGLDVSLNGEPNESKQKYIEKDKDELERNE